MCAYLEWWSKEQQNKLFLPSSPVTSVIIQLYKSFLCKCWVFICTLTWSERDETVKQGRYLKIQTEETTEIQKYWELNTQTFLKTSFRLVSCTDVSHRLAAGRQGGRPSVPFTPERVHLRWKDSVQLREETQMITQRWKVAKNMSKCSFEEEFFFRCVSLQRLVTIF